MYRFAIQLYPIVYLDIQWLAFSCIFGIRFQHHIWKNKITEYNQWIDYNNLCLQNLIFSMVPSCDILYFPQSSIHFSFTVVAIPSV